MMSLRFWTLRFWTLRFWTLRVVFAATAMIAAGCARAAPIAAADTCQLYGYVPHTRDYATCRMNVRHYWSTGPCSDSRFASVHRRYCNLIPTLDF
jgi:hypothetical protein